MNSSKKWPSAELTALRNFHYDPPDTYDWSERKRQRQMLTMVRRLFPHCLITHIPNGGKRSSAREGAALKADGVMRGWPDLEIVGQQGTVRAEVKDATGTCSAAQKDSRGVWVDGQRELMEKMAAMGAWVGVFRNDRSLCNFLIDAGFSISQKWPHKFMDEIESEGIKNAVD